MRFSELTRDFIKDNYLFGVPLADQYGNEMSDGLLDHYIRAAIQYIQRTLQIVVEPIEITEEVHDYYQGDMNNWGFIQMFKKPVIEVTQLSMWYGGRRAFEIPLDWVRLYQLSAQVQLFPNSGSAGGMILTQNGSFTPMIMNSYSNAPSVWRISYRAGLDEIPDDLAEYIMKRASVGILQVWGDLIIGAGIANQTISLDGLSQSIGTTQSPEFSGAGARIKNYMDDMKELEKRLKDTYQGINFGVI